MVLIGSFCRFPILENLKGPFFKLLKKIRSPGYEERLLAGYFIIPF